MPDREERYLVDSSELRSEIFTKDKIKENDEDSLNDLV